MKDPETGAALEPNGVFRIRSMTKPMVGTVALRLIERGELSLDDAAAKYRSNGPRARRRAADS